MCGFVGFTGPLENKENVVDNMAKTIIHRGPDYGGSFANEDIALGFRSLHSESTENGGKPISNEDSSMCIVFDGEIYNYEQLKSKLSASGHEFKTNAVSEVVLHCYEEFGTGMFDKLRGMFSFVIWNEKDKSLFGARDFFGIKPFYYAQMDKVFMFGSEIKSFLPHPGFKKEINPDAVKPFLVFQYPVTDEAFFKNVFRLLPAHYFTWKNGNLDIVKYKSVEYNPGNKDEEYYIAQIDKVVRESVEAHRIEGAGGFLSSGIDSSYITACVKPEKTFTVGFARKQYSEIDSAQALSEIFGIENYSKILTADECFDAFSNIQYHADEPEANPSAMPLYYLARLASEHVSTVFSGEGADELFAGYPFYRVPDSVRKYKKAVPGFIRRGLYKLSGVLPEFKGKNFLIKGGAKLEEHFIGQASLFREKEAGEILADKYKNGVSVKSITKPIYDRVSGKDDLTKMQYLDMHLWLARDMLLKADKMCMAHSLSVRTPFLDENVMKLAASIPPEYKIKGTATKYPLRQAANKSLPDEWAKRRKIGFYVPIIFWLREEKYYKLVKEMFNKEYAGEFFDVKKINRMLELHYHGKKNYTRKIWVLYTFLVWYERYFIQQ